MDQDFIQRIRDRVTFDPRSVHYNKRRLDGMYEIVARTEVNGEWREVVLNTQPNRKLALNDVRFLRGHTDASS